ncbi:MAG TPA: D-alanyl-D-alanine carboxypeptidase family protein, partial [Thermohalobaculum sp.]|nr:D-alanyl-D-alanine carboxypeptidase family protein [Thermohalobaculum sp.]
SRHAASMPPSKLYLKAGQKVTIRSLIRAAAIKSSNDAAVVLAEAIAGSEPEFGKLMTAKARQLGMHNTTFKNASGLTARGHLSTARDMATLGRHLFFDFPQYYNIFSRKSDRAAGKRVWTTNRLLSSYRGADGIKTGYTNAAGYNLVASAHRGNERVIAALLGGKSSRSRNAKMVKLLDMGFQKAPTQAAIVRPRAAATAVAEAPLPAPRPGVPVTGLAAIAEALSSQAQASVPASTSRLAPIHASLPPSRPVDNAAAGWPLPVARPEWSVQLGTFDSQAVAVARLTEVMLGDVPPLAQADPVIDKVEGPGQTIYRVRIAGLSPDDARSACRTIRAEGRDCDAVLAGG